MRANPLQTTGWGGTRSGCSFRRHSSMASIPAFLGGTAGRQVILRYQDDGESYRQPRNCTKTGRSNACPDVLAAPLHDYSHQATISQIPAYSRNPSRERTARGSSSRQKLDLLQENPGSGPQRASDKPQPGGFPALQCCEAVTEEPPWGENIAAQHTKRRARYATATQRHCCCNKPRSFKVRGKSAPVSLVSKSAAQPAEIQLVVGLWRLG